jgi:hypothetical protein
MGGVDERWAERMVLIQSIVVVGFAIGAVFLLFSALRGK